MNDMKDRMMMNKPRCLALGMGAIGRAVSGYAMTQAGVHVTFADIAIDQIERVCRDGGYWLGTADIYSKQLTKAFISDVDAVHVESQEAQKAAMEAQYIISAVGPVGFRALLERVIGWLQARAAISSEPLFYMVFENDPDATVLLRNAVQKAFGQCPPWLHIVKCSIERMTKVMQMEDLGSIAVGETFFPIIADGNAMRGSSIFARSDIIQPVETIEKYYFRKLLTNNLGHCVLGYAGYAKGYRTTTEAMADPEIYDLLRETLCESAKAVCMRWGFLEQEIQEHIEILMLRYNNPELADDLLRLCRDPLRKIAPQERIMLPIQLCLQYGIKPNGLVKTLYHAIHYTNPEEKQGKELIELRRSIGEDGILETICGTDVRLFHDVQR